MTDDGGGRDDGCRGARSADLGLAKRVLYCSPGPEHLDDLMAGWREMPGCKVDRYASPPYMSYDKVHVRMVPVHDLDRALSCLHTDYFNLVVVDLRALDGRGDAIPGQVEKAARLLEAMAKEDDVEARFGFHRVLVLVAGADNDQIDQLMVDFGARGVGCVIRDWSGCVMSNACAVEPRRAHFLRRTANEMLRMMLERKRGKRALCAAGGGITGIYFEMGALKCLDDCMSGDGVNGFDMFFGISAGAVVTSFLANGYTVDESMAAVAGYEGGRMPPTSMNLFRLRHVNFSDYRERLGRTTRELAQKLVNVIRGRSSVSFESLIMEYSDFVAAPFHGETFEVTLRELNAQAHATNDFRKLPRPLYVGATDQDTRSHVLFGGEGWDDVPISQAVQASLSINPAFRSARIRGRYYEDGAVTRTSNFVEAIRRGADLLFVIDPFLPYVSKEPGFARQRGILYNVDQDIRTISYTRYENMRNLLLHHHPHVSSYTFLPANRLRLLMSINPMDHRPYMRIWRGAYLSTLQRIKLLYYRMNGDLAVHGVTLDTEKAEAVADRLERIEDPVLSDFFPDGKLAFRRPPSLERGAVMPRPPRSNHNVVLRRVGAGPSAA